MPRPRTRVDGTCSHCGRVEPACGFPPSKPSTCRDCHAAWRRAGYLRSLNGRVPRLRVNDDPAVMANNSRGMVYLIDGERFRTSHLRAMTDAQGGVCAICGGPPKPGSRLHVDHDHDTGEVRGLLCFRCNVMLGHARDDAAILQAAIAYLTQARVLQ